MRAVTLAAVLLIGCTSPTTTTDGGTIGTDATGTDAGPTGPCGDGICEGWPIEAAQAGPGLKYVCEADCGAAPLCSNGQCDVGEDWLNCPWDCAAWCPGPVGLGGACEPGDVSGLCCGSGDCTAGNDCRTWCCADGDACGAQFGECI